VGQFAKALRAQVFSSRWTPGLLVALRLPLTFRMALVEGTPVCLPGKPARPVGGTRHAPTDATVTELVEADIETRLKLGKAKASTADTYQQALKRHIAPTIGKLRAQDLRGSHLDALYGDLLKKGLSPATVRLVHTTLSGPYRRAKKRRNVAENPCADADPPENETPETPSWSPAELRAFFAHDVVRDDPDFALFWTLASSGLRRGEGLGLAWDDVDLDAGIINVRRNAVLVAGEVVIQSPKTKRSRRKVRVGPDTVQVLRDHLTRQREHRLAMGSGWHDDDNLVFPAVDGRPRNPVAVSGAFHRLVERTGLPPITLHGLRHSHTSLLLDAGEKIHDVAARLGDDPAILLRVYAHHGRDSQDRAAALESLLGGDRPALRAVGED
jgi:integrase